MFRYVFNRLLQGIVALFLASIVVFGMGRLTGDPLALMAGELASAEDLVVLSEHLGLDKPIFGQYWIFITNALRGDLGTSFRYRGPVADYILKAAPATIQLTAMALLFSILLAIPAGVLGAVKRNRWQDTIGKVFAILGQAWPGFWLGIVLIQVFAVQFGVLPAGGYGGLKYWILPTIALGWSGTAGMLRLTRSAMLDILQTDYVRLARIKGASETTVIWKHALRNALIPVITFGILTIPRWLMGSVIIESVFSWPGVGLLAYTAVVQRDFPMMQGIILIFVGVFVIANLITDVLYCYLDPRVRYVKE